MGEFDPPWAPGNPLESPGKEIGDPMEVREPLALQPQPERARIFMTTGQYVDVAVAPVPNGWALLITNILQNRGFLFDQIWIPERTIRLIVRNPGAAATDPSKVGDNVVPLRPIG